MNEIASHNLSNISNFFTHSLCLFRSNNTSLDPPLFSSFAFTYQVISIFTTFTGYIIGSVLRKKNVEFSWANIVSFHGTINRINTIEFTVVVFFCHLFCDINQYLYTTFFGNKMVLAPTPFVNCIWRVNVASNEIFFSKWFFYWLCNCS